MKDIIIRLISILSLSVVCCLTIKLLAEILVRCNKSSVKVVLLKNKTQLADNNITSILGRLDLPHVQLINNTKLKSFINTINTEWGIRSVQDRIKTSNSSDLNFAPFPLTTGLYSSTDPDYAMTYCDDKVIKVYINTNGTIIYDMSKPWHYTRFVYQSRKTKLIL